MKKLFPLLLTFHLFKAVYSQSVIEGFVSDIKGKPITHAQVLLYSGSNIIAYAFVNSEGMFQVKTSQKGDFKLECTALGYEKAVRYIKPHTDSSLNMPLRVNFVLKETAYQINEVIKYGDKPIVVKPDTIIYNVKSFVTGNERVVEDVLKNLPGINVDDYGRVTFKGKEVEKVMIEQNDFFGKGYKMITQNVHANAIEKVEAISNYSENPLLKGLSNPDKVALNLRLTDDAYKKIYTNLELGYSTINYHDAYMSLMNFGKKYSTLVFGNSDRLSKNINMGYSELVNSLSLTSDDNTNTTPIPDYLINLEGYRPTLKRQRVDKLATNLVSLNEAINLSAKTRLTITSVYNQSNNWFTKNSIQKLSYDTLSIVNSEIYNFSQNDKSALLKTKIESTPSSKSYIHHNLLFSGNVRDALTQNNFNMSFVNEDVNAKSYYLNTNVDYTNKIYNQVLLQFKGAAYIGNNDEDYLFDPLPFTHVSDISVLNGQGSQKITNDYEMITGSSGIKLKLSKFLIESELGLTGLNLSLKNSFYAIDSLNNFLYDPIYSGNTNYNHSKAYFKSLITYGSDSLKLTAGFNIILQRYIYNKNTEITQGIILPEISFKWVLNRINTLNVFYNSKSETTPYANAINHYYFTNYNSITRGLSPSFFDKHYLGAIYSLGTNFTRFFMNCKLLYTYEPRFITNNFEPTFNYSILSDTLAKNRNTFIAIIETNYFISAIRSNVKLLFSNITLEYSNYIFGISNRNKSRSTDATLELRSAFKSAFNFHMGYTASQGKILNKKTKSVYVDRFFCNLYAKFSNGFTLELLSEIYGEPNKHININGKNFLFLNSIAKYHLPNSKWDISFTAFNLLNEKNYSQKNILEFSYTEVRYSLIPRYFMLTVSTRF